MSDDGRPAPSYRDIELEGLWPNDGREAVREALRLIEEAARRARSGASAQEVADMLEQARGFLGTGAAWILGGPRL